MTHASVALGRLALLGAFLSALGAAAVPAAAEYPERPLTIVNAYPPGGMVDMVARPLAEGMKKKFPKGVAVVSRPGGGGSLGLAEVVQSKPDGYTLVLAPVSTLVIQPQVNNLPYKTPDDYAPILNTIAFHPMLAVRDQSPYRTVQEFIAAAKAAPGRLRVGTPGEATSSHLNLEEFQRAAGFKITHVPFSGWGEGSPALLGGHIEAIVAQPGELRGQVAAKKMRTLLAFQARRHPVYPDTPTARELGWDVALGAWFVLTAPKATPAPVLKYIHDAAKTVLEEPKFVEAMNTRAVEIVYKTGEQCRQDLWQEYRRHTEILSRLGMLKKK